MSSVPSLPRPSRLQTRASSRATAKAASPSISTSSPAAEGAAVAWADSSEELDTHRESPPQTPLDWAEVIIGVVKNVLAMENKYLSNAKAEAILGAVDNIKNGYTRILEQNISLKDQLSALLSGTPTVTAPPPPSKTIIVRPSALAQDPVLKKNSIADLQKTLGSTIRDKAITVDTITTRRNDIAIKIPDTADSDDIINTINASISNSGQASLSRKLQPEIMVSLAGTSDITADKILQEVPNYMPSARITEWKIIRSNAKAITLRLPAVDRDRIIRDGFIVINSLRLRCRDVIGVRACFTCGSCHNQSSPCRDKKMCLTCGGSHEMRDCPNKDKPLDTKRCSLCNGVGHNFHEGPPCKVKLNHMREKYLRTERLPGGPAYNGPFAELL
ncbi:hypothetical protein Pmar_PMAR005623 [Perkinsus marinus ATCC 50983]|uniref:CCHC-type domain-containing protein n=1 Tax=Perkinsus marinus (strain ATCC 50983 / TXsc) TaxID=423536 RepID=C5KLH8_PERM5|nr:hypothetical protein Pmar_PMAR005623 [Perkinsus marinus ATCC 50983]EER14673.1 hypothetical protein Pmar_PMAR005623 [Perkinsus marinus ATCC 50983]|eukprot:XP_002782877.1 hypothetical protein Pmar_PMAR005623 [Perkinsus marinus ATCC 50983]